MTNSSNSSKEKGNTKPSPKQDNPKKRYCFTLNNYSEKEYNDLLCFFKLNSSNKYIIGREIGESGTPHLQCYCNFANKIRFTALKKICDRLHVEVCRGTEVENLKYCAKELNYTSNCIVPKETQLITREMMREKQLEICDMFKDDEHPIFGRKIYWFWEKNGNWGKSITATYMIDNMNATEVSGKGADVLCGIAKLIETQGQCPPIVIYDIPRCNVDFVSYMSIEKLKDGKFFSGKYESGMVRYNKPHIICFANEPPDMDKLSLDRWIVKELK